MTVATRKPYLTDLTDEQWAILEPLIPAAKHGGHPREVDMREVLNSLFYNQPTDAGSLAKVDPVGMQFLSPDELMNIELYAIANKLGLPTDGQLLFNACLAASGPILSSVLPVKISAAWLHNLGAF